MGIAVDTTKKQKINERSIKLIFLEWGEDFSCNQQIKNFFIQTYSLVIYQLTTSS